MAEHQSDRIIDRHERRRLVPYSDNHILRLERAGSFPERLKLGANRVGWLLSEVLDWIARRKNDRKWLDR
jgi:prophage regulatory protein